MRARCGIFASARRPAPGGGPASTVDIIETVEIATTTSGSGSASVTTALQPNDRVVVITTKASTSGTPTVSGLGATWTNDVANTAGLDLYVASATGISGGGTVNLAGLGAATDGEATIFVLRSSVGDPVVFAGGNAANAGSAAAGAITSTSAATAPAGGCLAFAVGAVSNTAITFPAAGTVPSSGWAVDRTTQTGGIDRRRVMHQKVAAGGSIQATVTASGFAAHAVARAAYTD